MKKEILCTADRLFILLNRNRILLFISVTALLISGCKKEEDLGYESYSEYQIAISTEKCIAGTIHGESEGIMVKGENNIWSCSVLPYRIKGFGYKEGYEYELFIRETVGKMPNPPPMDYDPVFYTLIEVISMTPVDVPEEK